MENEKIAREEAEKEFADWCDLNMIDADTADMSEEDENDFNRQKKTIVRAIRDGRAVIDGESVTYTISSLSEKYGGQEVKFTRPSGRTYTSMGNTKEKNSVKRMYAGLSEITGLADGTFNQLAMPDLNFFIAVFKLFLAD